MPTAVLYARFSDRPNAEACESVEHQLAQMREWCAERDVFVRGEFFDKAKSGADRGRPGFFDAIQACRRGDLLLVRDWERFARDRTFAGITFEELARRGVTAKSITENGDMPDTMESRLLRNILLELAEYRRHLIAAQIRNAMLRHQANGRSMGGQAPYGYKKGSYRYIKVRGARKRQQLLTPDPEEQAVIDVIRDLDHLKDLEVAKQLNAMGLPCRGREWHAETIKRIRRREGRIAGQSTAF